MLPQSCAGSWCLSVLLLTVLFIPAASAQSPEQFDLHPDDQFVIDFHDLLVLASQWGTSGQPGNSADWNGDGTVDQHDLLIFLRYYGASLATPTPTGTPTYSPTPTPTTSPTSTPTPTHSPTPTLTATATFTATLTPTPILTPTPTPVPVQPTPTETPTVTHTATPTETPSPTSTPTVTPTPTAVPPPSATPTSTPPAGEFAEFFFDFENVTPPDLPEGLRSEMDPSAVALDRLMDSFGLPGTLFPWFTRDETTDPEGLAYSGTRSACLNGRSGWYDFQQTSILTIDRMIDTTPAGNPRLEFQVAYEMEGVTGGRVFDYLAVEVSTDGGESYSFLDLNADGVLVDDPRLNGFDALFGTSDINNDGLDKGDFQFFSLQIPSATSTVIAFRFSSDSEVSSFRGVFLDDIRIYDAAVTRPQEPVIDRVSVVGGGLIYADIDTALALEGAHLSPAESVTLAFDANVIPLSFQMVSDQEVRAVIPRLATPELSVTALLTLTRVDGFSAQYPSLPILAAPTPEIVTVEPSPIFLEADNRTLTIRGNHFRPPDQDGKFASIVGIGQQVDAGMTYEAFTTSVGILSISRSEIVIDPFPILRRLVAGSAIVQVTNPYSGLVSEPFVLAVREGAGQPAIEQVMIDFVARPFVQSDEEQTLIIIGENFSQTRLNLSIGGVGIISDGLLVDPARTQVFVDPTSITVVAEPGVVTATGSVQVTVDIAGHAVTSSYEVRDPLPPELARVEPLRISAGPDQFITVVGDNFRGKGNEEPTRVELLPAMQSGEILPEGQPISLEVSPLDIVIDLTEGADDVIDRAYLPADGLNIPAGETRYYRVRLTNPYSGLITIEPRPGSTIADVLVAVSG